MGSVVIASTLSWVSTVGGGWGFGSNWSSGAVPDPTTDVLLGLPGGVVIQGNAAARSVLIDDPGVQVQLFLGTLSVGGTLEIDAGSFLLEGTVAGATIVANGGSFILGGFADVLAGVTYQGALTLGNGQDLTIEGLTLLGSGGTGAGTLAVSGGIAIFDVTQTLSTGTIQLGNYGAFPDFAPSLDIANGATLTLGAAAVLQTTGISESVSGPLVNAGTIAAATAGDVLTFYGALLNQGRIAISGHDEVVIAPGATLTNAGSISVSAGGTLALLGGFANLGSISAAGGTLLVGGAANQAELLALQASGGAVIVTGTLDNTGGTIAVGQGGALGTLAVTGAILGGTIQDSGGGLLLNGGTLDAVTYRGTLAVGTNPNQPNAVRDGLTFAGPGGVLSITGGLTFANTEAISVGLINLGGPGGPASLATAASVTATLGPGVDLEQTGATVGLGGSFSSGVFASISSGQTLVSQGTIDAGFAGGAMVLGSSAELINRGLLEIRNQDTFLAQGTLLNAGTLLLGSGGTLEVFGPNLWSNSGTVIGSGGTVVLAGPVGAAELQSFAGSGAAVIVAGTLDNTSGTLALGSGAALSGLTLASGGVIRNGVVLDGGGGVGGAGGAFSGVTFQGQLGLTHTGDRLTLLNATRVIGANGTGVGTIAVTGDGAALIVPATQSLSAAIRLGGAAAEADLTTGSDPGSAFTLGAPSLLTQVGRFAGLNGVGTIANQGTIQATLPGGTLQVAPSLVLANSGTISVSSGDFVTIGSLANAGQVSVASGAVLSLQAYSATATARLSETGATLNLLGPLGLAAIRTVTRSGGVVSVGGTLDLGGGTIAVGGTTALGQLRDNGVIANGTIADGGGGIVYIGSGGARGVLRNVTYRGLVNLNPALSTLIVQGLTAVAATGSGPGVVNVLGAGSALTFQGSQTFDNATLNFGSANRSATLSVTDPTGTGAILTLGTGASLQHRGAWAEIDVDRGFGDALVNNGLIAANSPNGHMIILGGTFTNAGRIVVTGGDTLAMEVDQFTNLPGALLSGGYWQVDANSTLNLGLDNPILNLNATLALNGPGSQVVYFDTTTFQTTSLEQTINYIGPAGVLALTNRVFTDPGLFFVIGKVVLANATVSGAPIAIGSTGLIYGTGTVAANAIYDSGHVLAQGGQLVVNAPLLGGSPVGNALIAAGATLTALQAVAVPVLFQASTGTLAVAQAGALTGMIGGFTGSDAIDLLNVNPTGLSLSYAPGTGQGVLTVKAGSVTKATLRFSGTYVAGNFRFTADGHGGTLILDPPVAPLAASTPGWQITPADLAAPPGQIAAAATSHAGTLTPGFAAPVVGSDAMGLLAAHS